MAGSHESAWCILSMHSQVFVFLVGGGGGKLDGEDKLGLAVEVVRILSRIIIWTLERELGWQ